MDQVIYGVNRSSVDPQDIFFNMPAFMVTRNSTTTGNDYKLSFMTNPTLSNLEPEFTFKSEIKLTGTSLGTLNYANNEYYKEVSTGDIGKCPTQTDDGQKLFFCEVEIKFFNIPYYPGSASNQEIIGLKYTFKVPVDDSSATINIQTTNPRLKASADTTFVAKDTISAME
jgi:hypothetical protein